MYTLPCTFSFFHSFSDEEVLSSSPSFPFRGGIYKIEEGVFSTSSGDVVTAAKIGDDCTAADAKANGGADQIDKETNDQETLVLGCDSRMQMLFLPAKKTFSNCEDKSTAASKARTSANIPSNKGTHKFFHSKPICTIWLRNEKFRRIM